jgi:protein-L-isoaspartate(D-aspartate) O-methyltransferase
MVEERVEGGERRAGDRGLLVTRHPALRAAAERSGVTDGRVLDALDAVPRERFLPLAQRQRADLDAALPLAHGQTTSQPSLIAQMVEALALVPESRVLEIGTGHGYEAAILSHLVAEVWTVEYVVQLAHTAREILLDLGADNVHVVAGDGRLGLPEHAPYDGILVAAQCETLPPALVEQLAVGGRLVAPVGDRRAQRCVVLHRRLDGGLEDVDDLGGVRFVPLV